MPLAEVVGRNARNHRLRHDAKLEDVARVAKRYGLKWSTGRVGDLEGGRMPATLPTLFALAATLGDVTGERVSIADLVWTDGWVEVNPSLTVSGEALKRSVQGEPVDLVAKDLYGAVEEIFGIFEDIRQRHNEAWADVPTELQYMDPHEVDRVEAASGVAEQRLCKEYSLAPHVLAAMSLHLWGKSFSEERDNRAGEGANAQRRGRISREMKQEIEAYLASGGTDGDGQ